MHQFLLHSNLFISYIMVLIYYTDVLKPCNIKEVLDQMWEYRARWKFIGIELGIGEHSLDAIEANYPRNVDDCLREMIHCWLKNVSPRPTRRAMRVALQSKSVSNTAGI